jgi:hypothetical protein
MSASRRIRKGQGAGRPRPAPRPKVAESPLAWLAGRRDRNGRALLSAEQVEAGERLRRDFTKAGLTPHVTQSWSAQPGTAPGAGQGRGFTPTELSLAAKQRFQKALDALGPGLADVTVRVCCHLEGIEQAETGLGWPRRSAKLVLTLALDRLAAHYGLTAIGRRASGIQGWRAEGAVPLTGGHGGDRDAEG